VKRSLYREQDYAFGQLMLTLRMRIGLTQAGLAERLRVSRHAIVAQTISELFGGEIVPFLEQGEVVFGGVRELLEQQKEVGPGNSGLLTTLRLLLLGFCP